MTNAERQAARKLLVSINNYKDKLCDLKVSYAKEFKPVHDYLDAAFYRLADASDALLYLMGYEDFALSEITSTTSYVSTFIIKTIDGESKRIAMRLSRDGSNIDKGYPVLTEAQRLKLEYEIDAYNHSGYYFDRKTLVDMVESLQCFGFISPLERNSLLRQLVRR